MKIVGQPHIEDEDRHCDAEETVGQRFYARLGIHAGLNLRFIRRPGESGGAG
jgi:hypothetical protein